MSIPFRKDSELFYYLCVGEMYFAIKILIHEKYGAKL